MAGRNNSARGKKTQKGRGREGRRGGSSSAEETAHTGRARGRGKARPEGADVSRADVARGRERDEEERDLAPRHQEIERGVTRLGKVAQDNRVSVVSGGVGERETSGRAGDREDTIGSGGNREPLSPVRKSRAVEKAGGSEKEKGSTFQYASPGRNLVVTRNFPEDNASVPSARSSFQTAQGSPGSVGPHREDCGPQRSARPVRRKGGEREGPDNLAAAVFARFGGNSWRRRTRECGDDVNEGEPEGVGGRTEEWGGALGETEPLVDRRRGEERRNDARETESRAVRGEEPRLAAGRKEEKKAEEEEKQRGEEEEKRKTEEEAKKNAEAGESDDEREGSDSDEWEENSGSSSSSEEESSSSGSSSALTSPRVPERQVVRLTKAIFCKKEFDR